MPGLDPLLSGSAKSVVDMRQFSNRESSCPDLIRASTPFLQASEGVDGRIKSGHDDAKWYSRRLRLVVGAQKPEPDSSGTSPAMTISTSLDQRPLV